MKNRPKGVELHTEGRFEDAAKVLREALREQASSELANDWVLRSWSAAA